MTVRISLVLRGLPAVLVLNLMVLLAPEVRAGDTPPDLTGIWTWDREANPGAGRMLMPWPEDPPFTAEGRRKVEAYRALVEPTGASPGGFCLGSGMPSSTLGSGGYPMEIIQRPEQVTIIQEAHNELRRIYLQGPNTHVDARDLIPTRNGYSVGRWEGDTLVVETTSLKEAVDQRSPHSEEAHILERYRLTRDAKGRKILRLDLTLTDARFYTKPVAVTKTWVAADEGSRMLDYECNEPDWEDHLRQLAEQAANRAPAAGESH